MSENDLSHLTKGERRVINMIHALKIVLIQTVHIDWLDQCLLDGIVYNLKNRYGSLYEIRQLKWQYRKRMPSIEGIINKIIHEYMKNCYFQIESDRQRRYEVGVLLNLDHCDYDDQDSDNIFED